MKYAIKTIPHSEQRYDTSGDYWIDAMGVHQFRISSMGNEDYEFLVMVHELIEQYLTQKRGITEQSITEFDVQYEKDRPEGDTSEPGDSLESPYQNEHNLATGIERILCAAMGIKWEDYDSSVVDLA